MLGEIYYQNQFLTPEECQSLIAHFNDNRENAARSRVGWAPSRVDLTARISKSLQVTYEDEALLPLLQKVDKTAKWINEEIFAFDIDWEASKTKRGIWIHEYDGSEKGFWVKHQNVNWMSNQTQRKLCASLVLSSAQEYEGGDIQLYFGTTKDMPTPTQLRTQGILYIYPAFRFTEIMPVLSGTKYQMDFYWEGPHWR